MASLVSWADVVLVGPKEGGYLVVGGQVAASDVAAEDQGDDASGHVLVDAGECVGLDVESGFLADLAAQPIRDGLVQSRTPPGVPGAGCRGGGVGCRDTVFGDFPVLRGTVNSTSRGRGLTGKPVTKSNLSLRAPAQIPAFCTFRRSADGIVSCAPEWIDLRVATACDLRTV